ncbi:hypothetical protein [Synechococcus sp. A15-62]|uniref:hypothetical protein n=1 Tax=Synechococcus sp. A15-62 TaxID=1050657 RepID=UPI00164716EA|nr:hypothetical protein [Synechococcus sp. A15-62]
MTAVDENPSQSRHTNSADTDEVDWCLTIEQARQRRASVWRKISQLPRLVCRAEGRIELIEGVEQGISADFCMIGGQNPCAALPLLP